RRNGPVTSGHAVQPTTAGPESLTTRRLRFETWSVSWRHPLHLEAATYEFPAVLFPFSPNTGFRLDTFSYVRPCLMPSSFVTSYLAGCPVASSIRCTVTGTVSQSKRPSFCA